MPVSFWSATTPALNATIDPNINLSNGRAPSSVTPADRSTLAAIAQYRNDVAGSTVTTGTSTAYSLSTFSNFNQAPQGSTALQTLASQQIAFTPSVTNTAGSPSVTLTVDGLGPFPIRSAPNVELLASTILQGTPYVVLFSPTDSAFYLQGFYGSPNSVPLGVSLEFWGSTAPNSSFALMFGQTLSQTVYAALFAIFGTTYNTGGEAAGTFRIPDARGRVIASVDNMGGTAAGRLTSASGMGTGLLGQAGGAETETLTAAQIPSHTHANTLSDPGHAHAFGQTVKLFGGAAVGGSLLTIQVNNGTDGSFTVASAGTGVTISNAANTGGGGAHPNVQPAICANRILRII